MNRKPFRLIVLTFVAVLSGACASYQPAQISDIEPQEQIRLELQQAELGRLIQFADPETRTVSGRYIDGSSDSVSVVVQTPGSYTQVQIPRNAILNTSRRVVDNTKSFIISAVIVGGVAALAVRGFEGREGGPIGDGGGIDESRIPSFGFRIPFGFGIGN